MTTDFNSTQIYTAVRELIAPLDDDRALADDLASAIELVAGGAIATVVQDAVEAGLAGKEGSYVI
ncbi:hypothetical protein HF984_02425 [Rothia terrae]|uniref:hypothetical protein n=1 Tax=Rothia terrae TaxID=396015 RepID=UPI0014470017|nr:hypothetical protein [Rothia terrae]MDT0189615.1 hypothetical protein [Rothia terrae]NKZ33640.1 hypothetical protein [Rothia terrae]